MRHEEGEALRRTVSSTTSVSAPSATRPSATQIAGQWRSSTLMNRELEPQVAESSENCVRQPPGMLVALTAGVTRGRAGL